LLLLLLLLFVVVVVIGVLNTENGSALELVVLDWKGSENVDGNEDDVDEVKPPKGSEDDDADEDDVKSPNGSLDAIVDEDDIGALNVLSLGGGAKRPPFLSPGGGAKRPLPLLVLIFFSFFWPSPIWIFIFSPSFKLKSLNGAIVFCTSPLAAALSLSTSCLKSANATLKSNASFLSLNAIPM